MFESAEIGHTLDKESFKALEPALRTRLLESQRQLADSSKAVMVLIGGVEGAGKSETVNLLLSWLDGRGVEVHAPGVRSDEERERPRDWRFWRLIPPRGKIAILFGSWYTDPIVGRVHGEIDEAEFDSRLSDIVELERMLADEGVIVLKLWMHLGKKVQKKRLEKLRDDPKTAWRITPLTWKYFKKYNDFREASEVALRKTSVANAPWHIIEAADERYRHVTAATLLADCMDAGVAHSRPLSPRAKGEVPALPVPATPNVLGVLDLSQRMTERQYDRVLEGLEGEIARLTRKMHDKCGSMILVFEGPDAAGKGGAIRRVTAPIDARLWQFMSVAAPTDEEKAHPYLWRFWRHLPRAGRMTIYDRSWYGRVLVERIEGFCTEEEWQRAYAEIVHFEEKLTQFGTIVLKFWLAISPEEQLRRFQDREVTPYKQYKLTEEDWRNRAKWDAYVAAACDMIERTSTADAPWVLVEANDKRWARIKVLQAVRNVLEARFG